MDLAAKVGVDSAENETSEKCGCGSWYLYLIGFVARTRAGVRQELKLPA